MVFTNKYKQPHKIVGGCVLVDNIIGVKNTSRFSNLGIPYGLYVNSSPSTTTICDQHNIDNNDFSVISNDIFDFFIDSLKKSK